MDFDELMYKINKLKSDPSGLEDIENDIHYHFGFYAVRVFRAALSDVGGTYQIPPWYDTYTIASLIAEA